MVLDEWLNLVNECLSYEVPSVRTAAIDALPAFFSEYYKDEKQDENRNVIVEKYIKHLEENNKIVRMGHVLALGKTLLNLLIYKLIIEYWYV